MSTSPDDIVETNDLDDTSEGTPTAAADPAFADADETFQESSNDDDTEQEPNVAPGSLDSFDATLLPDALRQALAEKGYHSLTAVQQAVVEADTEARDLRISSQTGSGKTVAIGLALGRHILAHGARRQRENAPEGYNPQAPEILLLTPTRELAMQVKRELSWLLAPLPDAWVEVVTGGTSIGLERKNLSRGPRMIVATPGRALDHLQNGAFSGEWIDQLVLDEADQMLDMGFRDELSAIFDQLPNRRRTHLVSATFSGEVLRIAERYQDKPVRIEGTALGEANQDIEHVAHVVSMRHRYDALVNLLLRHKATTENDDETRVLVFTRTRADTIEVAERLQRDNLAAEPLSGDLAQAQRTRTLNAFRSGHVQTLIATDVAARGIDVKGIDLVVHLDPPGDADTFTHRSGRTGRAGRKGMSVLLLPPQARGRIERLCKVAGVKPTWAPIPTADKIRKLYGKLTKRKIYAALESTAEAEHLEYAKKLASEHPPEAVIAQLLAMVEVEPPCLPRDISEHFAAESRGSRRKPEGRRGRFEGEGRRGRFEGDRPPRGRFESRGRGDYGPESGGFARGGEGGYRPSEDRDARDSRGPRFRGPGAEGGRPFRGPREGDSFQERFDGPARPKFRGPANDSGRPFRPVRSEAERPAAGPSKAPRAGKKPPGKKKRFR